MKLLPLMICFVAMMALPPSSAFASGKPPGEMATHGDWRLDCPKDAKTGGKTCQLLQHIVNEAKDGKKQSVLLALAAIVPTKDKDGKKRPMLHIRLVMPLNLFLPAGIAVKLDEEKPLKLPFMTCTLKGCMAEFSADDAFREKLKNGKTLLVAYKQVDGKQRNVGVSLQGFTAGYAALAAK